VLIRIALRGMSQGVHQPPAPPAAPPGFRGLACSLATAGGRQPVGQLADRGVEGGREQQGFLAFGRQQRAGFSGCRGISPVEQMADRLHRAPGFRRIEAESRFLLVHDPSAGRGWPHQHVRAPRRSRLHLRVLILTPEPNTTSLRRSRYWPSPPHAFGPWAASSRVGGQHQGAAHGCCGHGAANAGDAPKQSGRVNTPGRFAGACHGAAITIMDRRARRGSTEPDRRPGVGGNPCGDPPLKQRVQRGRRLKNRRRRGWAVPVCSCRRGAGWGQTNRNRNSPSQESHSTWGRTENSMS